MHVFIKIPRPVDYPGPLESDLPIIEVSLYVNDELSVRQTSDTFFIAGIGIRWAPHRALLLPKYRGIQQVCNFTRIYISRLTASASSLSARPYPCLRALRQALASYCRKVVSLCVLC